MHPTGAETLVGAADDWAAVGAKATVAGRGGHEHPGHGAECRACGGLHRRTPSRWLAVWIAVGARRRRRARLSLLDQSHLWLDEALSVNIARLPVGDIPEALRHDGHPPLYYWLLHAWMSVFGEGDAAVRALSGRVLGRRAAADLVRGQARRRQTVGWLAVVLLALNPWAIRYATEARMYSLIVALALAAYLS